jgi:hypothetical protein
MQSSPMQMHRDPESLWGFSHPGRNMQLRENAWNHELQIQTFSMG